MHVTSCATSSEEALIPSAAAAVDMALNEGEPSNMGISTQGGAQSPDIREAVAMKSSGPFQTQTETAILDRVGKGREAAEVDVDVQRVPGKRSSTPAAPESSAGVAFVPVEAAGVSEVVHMDLLTHVENLDERDFPEAVHAIQGQAGGSYSVEGVNDKRTGDGIAVEVVLEGAAASRFENPSGTGMVVEDVEVLDDGVEKANMDTCDGRGQGRGGSAIDATSTVEILGVPMDLQKELMNSVVGNTSVLPVATEGDASVASGMAEEVQASLHENALGNIAEKLTSDAMDILAKGENKSTATERENVAEQAVVNNRDEGPTILPVTEKEALPVILLSTTKVEEGPAIERTFEVILTDAQPSTATERENVAEEAVVDDRDEGATILPVTEKEAPPVILLSTTKVEEGPAIKRTFEAMLTDAQPSAGTKADERDDLGTERGDVLAPVDVLECSTTVESTIEASLPDAAKMMEKVTNFRESGDELNAGTTSLPPAVMLNTEGDSSSAAGLQLNSSLMSVTSNDVEAITVEESAIAEPQPNSPLTRISSEGPTISLRGGDLEDNTIPADEIVIRPPLDESTTPAVAVGCAEVLPLINRLPMSTAAVGARSSTLGLGHGPLDSGNTSEEEEKAREEVAASREAANVSSNPVVEHEKEAVITEGRASEATISYGERISVDDKSVPQRRETGEAMALAGGNENDGQNSQKAIDGLSAELGTTTETRTESSLEEKTLPTVTLMWQTPREKEEIMEMSEEEKIEDEMEEATVGGEEAELKGSDVLPLPLAAAAAGVIANAEIVAGEKDVEMRDLSEEAAVGTGVPATVSEELVGGEKVTGAGKITANRAIVAVEEIKEGQVVVMTEEAINNPQGEESFRMRMGERREEENVGKTSSFVDNKLDEAAGELVTSGGQFSAEEVNASANFTQEPSPKEEPVITEEKEAMELSIQQGDTGMRMATEGREENLVMKDVLQEGAAVGKSESGRSVGELPAVEIGAVLTGETNPEEHLVATEEAIEVAKNADPEVAIGVEREEDVAVAISDVVGKAPRDIMAAGESATAAVAKDDVEVEESLQQLVEAERTSTQTGGDSMQDEHLSDDGKDPVAESQAASTIHITTTVTVTREELDDDDETGGEDVDGNHGLLVGVGSSVENGGLRIMEVTSTTIVVEKASPDLASNSALQRGLSEPLITPPPEEILEVLEAVHHPLEEGDVHLIATRRGNDDDDDDVVVVDKASEGTEKSGDLTTVVVTTEEGEKVQSEFEGGPEREVSESEQVLRDSTLSSVSDTCVALQDPKPKDFNAAAVEPDPSETDTVEEDLSTAAATEAGIAAARMREDDQQQLQQTATAAVEQKSTSGDGMRSGVGERTAQANEQHQHAPNEVVDRASLDLVSAPRAHTLFVKEDLDDVDNVLTVEETPAAVASSGLAAGHGVSVDDPAIESHRHADYVPRSGANADLECEGGKMGSATYEQNGAAAELDKNEKKRGREENDVEAELEDNEKTFKAAKTSTIENSSSEATAAAAGDSMASVIAEVDVATLEDVKDDKKRSRVDSEGLEAAGESDSLLQSKIQKTEITISNDAGVQSRKVDAGGVETVVMREEELEEKTVNAPGRQDSGAARYKKRKIALFLGYSGAGYQGMQKNPGAITIEGELEEALFRAGAIAESNYGDPRKVDWRRAARTDKGVSALGQVVSGCFFIDPPGFIQRVNSHLPKQIRVFGYKRATATFNAKKLCDRRRYQYVLPVYVFDPSVHLDRQTARSRGQAAGASVAPESIVVVNTQEIKSITAKIPDPAREGEAAAAVLDLMEEAAPVHVEDEEKESSMILSDSSPKIGVKAAVAAVEAAGGASLLEQATTNAVSTDVEEVFVLEKSDVQDNSNSGLKEDVVLAEQTKKVVNVTKAEVAELLLSPAETKLALDEKVKKSTFEFGEAESNRLNRILKKFEGHHNFHNFTARTKSSDPSANRYILSFEGGDKTFTVDGMEFVKCTVVGQSFMLHQIRKMIGLTVAIMRGLAPESILDAALRRDTEINVPMAPELGLFLEECYYSAYNRRFERTHEELSLSSFETEIGEFKQEFIYPHIVTTETRDSTFAMWLHTLNERNFPEFLVARAQDTLVV